MIDEFGTLGAVLAASLPRLLRAARGDLAGVREVLHFRRAMKVALRSRIVNAPVETSWPALFEYLSADMACLRNERIRLLHMNGLGIIFCDEVAGEGTIDESPFYIREIIRRALELGSKGIIIAHNHPSGSPEPSLADIDVTLRLARACHAVGITLYDHIIIASEGHTSLRLEGRL